MDFKKFVAAICEAQMKRFVEGADRGQSALFPECLDWIDEDNPVRVIDVFVDELALGELPISSVSYSLARMGEYMPSKGLTVLFGLAVAYAPHRSDRPSRAKPSAPTFLLDDVPDLKPIDSAAHQQPPGFSLSFTGRRGGWKC